MFKRTKLAVGLSVVCGGVLLSASTLALAQQQLERVEVTGSAIKRIDAETSVPVTIIKIEDLKREGVTTIEQVISRLSVAQSSQGTSQAVGSGTGGAAFADLRGIGADKTLILLNGRRVANNAFDSSATDVNMIPFAALERVEVLRDGASALYGTDAIGGVINFITKKNFQGGSVTVGGDFPQESGGRSVNFNIGYGIGDIDKDRFNVLAVVDYQKQNALQASQRDFGATGFIPSRGVDRTSGTTFPASYSQTQLKIPAETNPITGLPVTVSFPANPAAPGCAPPFSIDTTGAGTNCRYDFTRWIDLIPETERLSFFGRASAKLSDDHTFNLEYFRSSNTNKTVISPVPQTGNRMYSNAYSRTFDVDGNPVYTDLGTVNPYFPGNGLTPLPPAFPAPYAFNPASRIGVNWRSEEAGPRQGETTNVQQRIVLSLEGIVAGWDYQGAVSYNQNRVDDKLTGGYNNDGIIFDGIINGVINPFGTQSAAGAQLIQDAALRGTLQSAKGTVYGIDARASRELGDWAGAGRQAALALGTELRSEQFDNVVNIPIAEQAASTGVDAAGTVGGSRTVFAVYGELNIPITKEFEITAALRFDDYSDFGNTTNPKIGFRYQPTPELLARGSFSTGFRAPSLYELYAPRTLTFTGNAFDDPVLCPDPVTAGNPGRDCNQQFLIERGGNTKLKPEEAQNLTFGFVFEPAADLSLGIDFWWINVDDRITQVEETLIFNDPVKYAARFNRAPDGSLDPDNGGFIVAPNENLGDLKTNGIDLSANYRFRSADMGTFSVGFNGTYVIEYEYQREAGGAFVQNVGKFVDAGPIFRWQHTLNLGWSSGEFGAGFVHRFKTGYTDQNEFPDFFTPAQVAQYTNDVKAYSVFDLYGTWQPTKAIMLTAGVRNVFDEDPPFSNQGTTFQVGYDPRFTDPIGRAFYLRGSYSF